MPYIGIEYTIESLLEKYLQILNVGYGWVRVGGGKEEEEE